MLVVNLSGQETGYRVSPRVRRSDGHQWAEKGQGTSCLRTSDFLTSELVSWKSPHIYLDQWNLALTLLVFWNWSFPPSFQSLIRIGLSLSGEVSFLQLLLGRIPRTRREQLDCGRISEPEVFHNGTDWFLSTTVWCSGFSTVIRNYIKTSLYRTFNSYSSTESKLTDDYSLQSTVNYIKSIFKYVKQLAFIHYKNMPK